MTNQKRIAEFFATVCYIGKIKFAPGTFGSIPAFPLCYIIMHFVLNNKIVFPIESFNQEERLFITLLLVNLLAVFLLFAVGTYFTRLYIKDTDLKDPSEVVIDETVGQMLTIILSSFSIFLAYNSTLPLYISDVTLYVVFLIIMPFILFRMFDIIKPWPINWLDEKVPGAFGIMIDDIAAAIFASVAQYVIVFFVVDFFKIPTPIT
jgi:phosphatidylglycerophosphatase A